MTDKTKEQYRDELVRTLTLAGHTGPDARTIVEAACNAAETAQTAMVGVASRVESRLQLDTSILATRMVHDIMCEALALTYAHFAVHGRG